MTNIDPALVEAIHGVPEYRAWRPTWSVAEHLAEHLAPAVDAARAEAWDEGYRSGHSNAMRRMSDEPNAPTTPNPYRKEGASTDG